MRTIVTWNPYPPIPIRTMDWAAYYEGEEESGNYGWGCTEQEAISDFLVNVVPDDLDDIRANLSDFFIAYRDAAIAEEEAAEAFLRDQVQMAKWASNWRRHVPAF